MVTPDAVYGSWWDRSLGRHHAYFHGLRQARAENRDHTARSLLVAAVGETPDGGSDARRNIRFATALTRLHALVYGRPPDPLSVEAALNALGIEHHARRRAPLTTTTEGAS